MRKLLLLTTILATPAFGADLNRAVPVKAMPAPVYDQFSGVYLGINGGYGWDLGNSAGAFEAVPLGSLNQASQGFLGGVQGGYGQRFNDFYLGIEGQIDGANLTGTANAPGLLTADSKNTWLASVRARLGIILFNYALFYGTAGWGWGGGEFTVHDLSGNLLASVNPTMSGFTWGGGIEHPFYGGWRIGLEYLQYDFGSFTTSSAVQGVSFTQKDRVDTLTLKLGYKFF